MVLYNTYIALSVLAILLSTNFRILDKINYWVLFAVLVSIMGLRSQYVGADSVQYYLTFKELNNFSLEAALDTRYAAGYVLFVRFVGLFSNSPYVFFFVVSLVTLAIYFVFLKKYSKNVFLAILVFFCLNWSNFLVLTREVIAVSCLIIGLPFLMKEKKIVFSIFVLLAMQFHASAIIAILWIPLYDMNLSKNKTLVFIGAAVILTQVLPLLWTLISYIPGAGIYRNYELSTMNAAGTSKVVDFFIKLFPAICGFIFAAVVEKHEQTKENYFFTKLCLVNICIVIIGMNSVILARLGLYFSIALPIVSSNFLFSNFSDRFSRYNLIAMFAVYCIALFLTIQLERPNWMKITPYSPFWQPVDVYNIDATHYFW